MKVAVFGVFGYLGIELIKILSQREDVEIVFVSSSMEDIGKLKNAEMAFLALSAKDSLHLTPRLLYEGMRVIDLSGAYRIKNPSAYPVYYGFEHYYPDLLQKAVYGLPEKNPNEIKNAKLIANPGCYATAINLGLLPLISTGFIRQSTKIVIEATSGYSGAGKYAKIPKSIRPYKSGRKHQHIPEIEQELNIPNQILMYPKVAPWLNGIDIFIHLDISLGEGFDLFFFYESVYKNQPFIKIKSADFSSCDLIGTNFCFISPIRRNASQITIKIAIDNLMKGGAGQAIQNLNIIMGLQDNIGL